MPIRKAAEAFGETMAEKAATGLCLLFSRLWNAEGLAKKKQFEEIVEPAFSQFLAIFKEYEAAFQSYRTELTGCDSNEQIAKLVNRVEGDLRFTASMRVDLLSHLEKAKGTVFEAFVRAITEFLVGTEESASERVEDALAPPEIAIQVYRRGLIEDLGTVLHSNWAFVLDPDGAAPPIYGDGQEKALAELRTGHGISEDDPARDGKLRAALAIDRLDRRVNAMVAAYRTVRIEYDKLRTQLLG